jgi:AhpC/TSA family
LLLAGLLLGDAGPVMAQVPGAQQPAMTIPAFQFSTHDRRVFANADLPKGKMLVFVFFDPDCEHCQHTVRTMDRELTAFQRAFVCMVSAATQDKIDLFAATYAPRLRAQQNVVFLQDASSQYMLRFKPIRYPSLYLYSPEKTLLDYEDNENTVFRIERAIKANAK